MPHSRRQLSGSRDHECADGAHVQKQKKRLRQHAGDGDDSSFEDQDIGDLSPQHRRNSFWVHLGAR